jgi:hypothetical protein
MHIDPLSPRPAAQPARPLPPAPPAVRGAEFRTLLARTDRVELSAGIPATPPPEVLEAVDAAARAYEELHARGRELRFERDAHTGTLVIEVRDLDGNVVRRIPPNEALAVASGELR